MGHKLVSFGKDLRSPEIGYKGIILRENIAHISRGRDVRDTLESVYMFKILVFSKWGFETPRPKRIKFYIIISWIQLIYSIYSRTLRVIVSHSFRVCSWLDYQGKWVVFSINPLKLKCSDRTRHIVGVHFIEFLKCNLHQIFQCRYIPM